MAESLNREQYKNVTINDDIIKDALKTGLSSIKASDYLVSQTLLKCRDEIEKEKHEKKSKLFIPWIIKLGTPLAAGALVLVLLINTSNLRLKGNSSQDMAPQASSNDILSMRGNGNADEPMETPAPSVDEDWAGNHQEGIDNETGLDEQFAAQFSSSQKVTGRTEISALHSSVSREPNIRNISKAEYGQPFNEIADLHNQANGIELVLEEAAITRINSLIQIGVSTHMLKTAKDYHEILSDEGYWALPLKNENEDIETILTVCAFDSNNPETVVTNRDIIYTIDRKKYIVSELAEGAYIGTELKELFDINAIGGIFEESGFTYESDIIVADINYGMDFIVLTYSGDQKLVVPFLTNKEIFGLENKKVYTWDEFSQTVSQNLEQ